MARILPLKAWRYNSELGKNLDALTAPLFDVVSEKQRELLYENPLNSIHLSVPEGDKPAIRAKALLKEWKESGVLVRDNLPGIYVYYQFFRVPGENEERCRKGFIAQIEAYDWEEGIIQRHENTITTAVGDRHDLLKETLIQASPTHGLYEDDQFLLESYMDAAMESPIYEIEDYQGVREVLAVIHDAKVISTFLRVLENKKVILADGHHRLQSAISFKNEMRSESEGEGLMASDFHLMYLTNAKGNHLKILPTHRLFYGLDMKAEVFFSRLSEWFQIRQFSDPEDLENYAFHIPGTFGLVMGEESFLMEIRKERLTDLNPDMGEAVRKLDLAILHDALFRHCLKIPMEDQRKSDQIHYERNFSRCVAEVRKGDASFAVITRELEMDQVLEVCNSGDVMPQKSTYFYPKALGGLLFGSIAQDEFEFEYEAFFGKTT